MIKQLPVQEFLRQAQQMPVIDVRSPGEFKQGHIPGAVNVPLFDNEERARVGTKYKQVSKDAAILLGLDIVGPKMSDFVKQAKKLSPRGEVLVHCWRGGMRSGSFAWLLATTGFQADTLEKGYKAYRTEVLQSFHTPLPLIVLGGKTGSGKTNLLKQIASNGEQVIDLEGLAHHKGSSFGAIGEMPQPTVEQFENNLHAALQKLDPEKRIWVEDESLKVGAVRLPMPFYVQMRKAPVIFIDVPIGTRIRHLVQSYTGFDHTLLEEALIRIKKRMGGQQFQEAMEALAAKDYMKVAALSLVYYDKAYLFGLSQREPHTVHTLTLTDENPAGQAQQIIQIADKIAQQAPAPLAE